MLQYTFLTTDEDGNEVVVSQGAYDPAVDTYAVGDTVTLQGADGAEKSWEIVRIVPLAYAGVSVYVTPSG